MTTKQTSKAKSTKRTTKPTSVATRSKSNVSAVADDFKSALLTVSLLINAGILIGCIALQVTTQYDLQVATFLFVR